MWFSRKKQTTQAAEPPPPAATEKAGLKKTRASFGTGLSRLFRGKKAFNQNDLKQLEQLLLMADVGVATTQHILKSLETAADHPEGNDLTALRTALRKILIARLRPIEQAFTLPTQNTPFTLLVLGANGAGKTTTIGKLAAQFKAQGHNVILAAGDTFRAAAVEQLTTWGERLDVPVIARPSGADSASVIHDALTAATSRGADVLLADTAGRLHNKTQLMDELKKIIRVMQKQDPTAPHAIFLVLDASIGQNALTQAKLFQEIGATHLILTKLDGTAKGGILFSIADQLALPLTHLGLGEGLSDLRPFNAEAFVDALMDTP